MAGTNIDLSSVFTYSQLATPIHDGSYPTTSRNDSTIIIEDDFESGTFQSFWNSLENVSISTAQATGGTYSSMYTYAGNADGDSWSEGRFDLGALYDEVTIAFDLYIPANYYHRDSTGPDNNKFLRLWPVSYNDQEKIGLSTNQQGSGESNLGIAYDHSIGGGPPDFTITTLQPDWIVAADLGTWISVKIYVKVATDVAGSIMQVYKNDVLFHENLNVDNNFVAGTQGYRYGYVMGWANSGFTADTYIHIDNFVVYEGEV